MGTSQILPMTSELPQRNSSLQVITRCFSFSPHTVISRWTTRTKSVIQVDCRIKSQEHEDKAKTATKPEEVTFYPNLCLHTKAWNSVQLLSTKNQKHATFFLAYVFSNSSSISWSGIRWLSADVFVCVRFLFYSCFLSATHLYSPFPIHHGMVVVASFVSPHRSLSYSLLCAMQMPFCQFFKCQFQSFLLFFHHVPEKLKEVWELDTTQMVPILQEHRAIAAFNRCPSVNKLPSSFTFADWSKEKNVFK